MLQIYNETYTYKLWQIVKNNYGEEKKWIQKSISYSLLDFVSTYGFRKILLH